MIDIPSEIWVEKNYKGVNPRKGLGRQQYHNTAALIEWLEGQKCNCEAFECDIDTAIDAVIEHLGDETKPPLKAD